MTFKKETFNWGIVRSISVGSSFMMIMHTHHFTMILHDITHGSGAGCFTDEQDKTWQYTIEKANEYIEFKETVQGYKISLPIKTFLYEFGIL